MRRRIEITLLMWICTCCLLVARPLAGQLDSLLSVTPLMRTSEAGIAVYDLTAGTSVYRHQADKLYRPASVEKVITSVTALSVLGTGYTFRTQLAYTGTIEQDTLKGDLYVIGGFDPEFMESDLVRLADAAGQAGIRVIKGRLVGDISLDGFCLLGTRMVVGRHAGILSALSVSPDAEPRMCGYYRFSVG